MTEPSRSYTIVPATTEEDLNVIKSLFSAYAAALGLDLSFQDFANELASLPGKYAAPHGTLLLVRNSSTGQAIGCVGLRPLPPPPPSPPQLDHSDDANQPDTDRYYCEMKRLYVHPQGRGTGVGRALAKHVVKQARSMGYRAMRLDTLTSTKSAIELYRSLGFREVAKYYDTPLEEDTIFLELDLLRSS